MSVTLATIADALIEFILSLLRDPDAAAEFDDDARGALASRGLSNISAADVCAVAPVVIDRAGVVASAAPPEPPDPTTRPVDPVVRQIQDIVNNFQWVDDRDTVVDQSVNQNIWADGDVTQVFDQDATVASGDDALAAGDDLSIDQSEDNSTTITAGDDANVGNDVTQNTVADSYNETVDSSTTTDASTDVVVQDSFDAAASAPAAAAPAAADVAPAPPAEESYGSSAVAYTEANGEAEATTAFDDTESVIVEDPAADDEF
jgi:hypothetical protein